jgi:type 1 glutamine amidotransferase
VQWANLAPSDYVMTNQVSYPERLEAEGPGGEAASRPAFTLRDTEVYLNHVLKGPHTLLMGLRYLDAKTGRVWVQQTAGWRRRAGQGWVFYFMPGHTLHDFENPIYGRVVMNAIKVPSTELR